EIPSVTPQQLRDALATVQSMLATLGYRDLRNTAEPREAMPAEHRGTYGDREIVHAMMAAIGDLDYDTWIRVLFAYRDAKLWPPIEGDEEERFDFANEWSSNL